MAALIPKTSLQAAKSPNLAAAASVAVQSCSYSQKPHTLKNPTLSNLKRGTGGRSSFNGLVCTIFGASGFIGKNLVSRLGRIGTQMIIPYRGDHYDVAKFKVCGDLGQVLFHPFDLRDEDSIRKCIKYSNVVINCIGREYETKNFKFNDVNVEGCARIARLCKESGVDRLIHLSCLNATAEPKPILMPEGSGYLKSKWEGEWAVKGEYPEATIIRPSDVYGQDDRFIAAYAHKWRQHFRGVPMWKKGEQTIKRPIWVGDVVGGIVAAVKDHTSAGRTYQFIGPERYKLSDIVDYLHNLLRKECQDYGYRRMDIEKTPLFHLKIQLTEALSPAYPLGYLHMEGYEKEFTSDNVVKGVPTIEDLGIKPIPINAQFAWEAAPHRYDGSYEYSSKEFDDLDYPKPLAMA